MAAPPVRLLLRTGGPPGGRPCSFRLGPLGAPHCPACMPMQMQRRRAVASCPKQWESNPVPVVVELLHTGGSEAPVSMPPAAGHTAAAISQGFSAAGLLRRGPFLKRGFLYRAEGLGGGTRSRWVHAQGGPPPAGGSQGPPSSRQSRDEPCKAVEMTDTQTNANTLPVQAFEGPSTLAEAEALQLKLQTEQGLQLPGGVVDRYLPPRDPSSLLLEPHKLTKEEINDAVDLFRRIAGGSLDPRLLPHPEAAAAAANLLVRARVSRQLRDRLEPSAFSLISFEQIKQIVEHPGETLLLLVESRVFGSDVAACLFADVALLLRKHGIELPIAVCALGSTTRSPSKREGAFLSSVCPHVFLLHPEGYQGEPGAEEVVELHAQGMTEQILKRQAAQTLIKYIQTVRPAASRLQKEAKALDLAAAELFQCEFAEAFVDDSVHALRGPSSGAPSHGSGEARQQQGVPRDAAEGAPKEGAPAGAPMQQEPLRLQAALADCRRRRQQKYATVIV
ncbi:hypothetical protein Efla_002624 [Eimeria flavescens]